MQAIVLVLNSGSSSIKFQLFAPLLHKILLTGLIESIGGAQSNLRYELVEQRVQENLPGQDYSSALTKIVVLVNQAMANIENAKLMAIGHRVVHGGSLFTQPVIITPEVMEQIKRCIELAPLHNPANLAGISAAQQAFPQIPQVAVFDTAFHQTMPEQAFLYALPYDYYQNYGIRRYGFHGISYQYLTLQAAKILKKPMNEINLICAHLGNGSSVCAIANGISMDTSMGFTPLEGLIMGTRSGDIDPGLFSYLAEKLQLSVDAITVLLNKQSGLLGISKLSMDMRELEQAASAGNQLAALAIEMFCYRLAKYIAAFMVPVRKLDALVFSGGIGENAVIIREKTLHLLSALGFKVNPVHNQNHGADNQNCISAEDSYKVLVIRTQEELMIAEETMKLVTKQPSVSK